MALLSTRQLFLITTNTNSKYSMEIILKRGTPLRNIVSPTDIIIHNYLFFMLSIHILLAVSLFEIIYHNLYSRRKTRYNKPHDKVNKFS